MLINLSNHPSNEWQQSQIEAAMEDYGKVIDLEFPDVDPMATPPAIESLADSCIDKVMALMQGNDAVIHIMGEMTLTYRLVNKFKEKGIKCIASCSKRECFKNENGQIVKTFNFKQFRPYF